jgi:hypothetical protein
MEKEFVPYELAVKLKTLGFNEPCFGGYNPNPVNDDDLGTLIYPTIKLNFEGENIIFNDTESDEPNCWTIEDDVILAPMFQQVFKWFREKYDLHHVIHQFTFKKGTDEEYLAEVAKADDTFSECRTYEDAEVACLEKLIEIIEEKQK